MLSSRPHDDTCIYKGILLLLIYPYRYFMYVNRNVRTTYNE